MGKIDKTNEDTKTKKKKTKATLQNFKEKNCTAAAIKIEEAQSNKSNKHKICDEKTFFSKKKKSKTLHLLEENSMMVQNVDRKQVMEAKNDTIVTEQILNDSLEVDEPHHSKKIKSKTKCYDHEEQNTTTIRKLEQKQRKKTKAGKLAVEELSNDNLEMIDKPRVEKKKNKVKKIEGECEVYQTKALSNNVGKKTIFIDDEPLDVPNNIKLTNNSIKNKRKKFLNDDEAEVNDEDIDKYCDELDEEDNKQYEEWVQLIEASMHSNKKSK